ncbi:MAG: hypothetical protein ACK4EY_16285 [Flavipsychrobacter sp.]
MKHKYLDIGEDFAGIMGELPSCFNGVIFGKPGQGKTEFCIRLAKRLTKYGRVAWMGYETGHSADMQKVAKRNKLDEVSGLFIPIDPLEKIRSPKVGETLSDVLFEDLVSYLKKRNSPQFVFIDSYDYTRFTFEQYDKLKQLFKKKKGIIWICHAKGNAPKLQTAKDIEHDGQFGINVKGYVAYVDKSRLGGRFPYIVWPEEVKRRLDIDPKAYSKDVVHELNAMSL